MPEQDRKLRSHITICTLPVPLTQRYAFGRNSTRRAVSFIQKALERNRFREPLLWCTSPEQICLLGRFPVRGVVYDCHREWMDSYLEQESALASQADVVFAASQGLVRRLEPCSENIVFLPNGVNPLMFERSNLSPPDQIASLSGHIVLGHLGDLTSHVDLKPLLNAATAHTDWFFLIIGRVTAQIADTLSRFSNIILSGPVSIVEVPDYLSVCTLFFDLARKDKEGCDILPSHVYEYLATGKPTVLVLSPETPDPHPDLIYTAYDSLGFIRRCKNALKEDPSLSLNRKEFAAKSSWANRASEISRIFQATGLF